MQHHVRTLEGILHLQGPLWTSTMLVGKGVHTSKLDEVFTTHLLSHQKRNFVCPRKDQRKPKCNHVAYFGGEKHRILICLLDLSPTQPTHD